MPPRSAPQRALAALAVRWPGGGLSGIGGAERRAQLDAALEAEARCFGGTMVGSASDPARLLRFDGPVRALRCAASLAPAAAAFPGSAAAQGLHVGEVEPAEAAALGPVARAARALAGEASPGEILASGLAGELAAGSGLHFVPRGSLAVEGLGRPLAVVRLVLERARTAVRPRDLGPLSPREREVLALVAEG